MERPHLALCSLGLWLYAVVLLSPGRGDADVLGHLTGLYQARTLSTGQIEGGVSFTVVRNEAF